MGGWDLISVHLLIVTKLTIVHAIVIEELFCFQGICSIAGCFLSCLSYLRAKMADLKLLVVRCIVLMPFPLHP